MGIMENIEGRKAAEQLLEETFIIIEEEVEKLPCEHSKDVFWNSLIKYCNTKIKPEEQSKPECAIFIDTDIDDLVDEIRELADNVIPDSGIEYAESCLETVDSIYKFFECNEYITNAQRRALENIKSGLQKWIRE
jgi:hypothetical protein